MKGFSLILAAAAVALAAFGLGQNSVEKLNDCPNGVCPRTIPFSATTAPKFEAPPAVGVAPIVNVDPGVFVPPVQPPVVVAPSTNGVQITPEQREALKAGLLQLAILAFGIFAGRGTTSPVVTQIIATVLQFLQSRQPSVPKVAASTRTRRRVARKKE